MRTEILGVFLLGDWFLHLDNSNDNVSTLSSRITFTNVY